MFACQVRTGKADSSSFRPQLVVVAFVASSFTVISPANLSSGLLAGRVPSGAHHGLRALKAGCL